VVEGILLAVRPRIAVGYEVMAAQPCSHCVIRAPDGTIALIERLYDKQGDFGVFLQQAHNWANFEQTKWSDELYQRYVLPHFSADNRPRIESFDWCTAHRDELTEKRSAAARAMFDKHEAEQKATEQAMAPRPAWRGECMIASDGGSDQVPGLVVPRPECRRGVETRLSLSELACQKAGVRVRDWFGQDLKWFSWTLKYRKSYRRSRTQDGYCSVSRSRHGLR